MNGCNGQSGAECGSAGRGGKTAVVLSAFVCPGAGQFMQGRYMAGTIFMGSFLACFGFFMYYALRIIIGFYKMAFDPMHSGEVEAPSGRLAIWFFASLLVFVAGLVDTCIAANRAAGKTR